MHFSVFFFKKKCAILLDVGCLLKCGGNGLDYRSVMLTNSEGEEKVGQWPTGL